MRAIEFHSCLAAELQRFVDVAARGRFRLPSPGAIAVVLRSVPDATAGDGTASDAGDHRGVSGDPRPAPPPDPGQPLAA